MNCIDIFAQKSLEMKDQLAFVSPFGPSFSFSELRDRVMRVQKYLLTKGFKAGDSVLIAIDVSIDLYATVLAVMGLGGTIVLVEPWMPIKRISQVINIVNPKFFVSSLIGNVWGLRVPEIRKIPHWVRPNTMLGGKVDALICESVDEKTPGVITFTSGTSGTPKGVVREQGYLLRQFNVLKKSLHFDDFQGSDLCIFANWALLNLAQGRPTVFFPANWSKKNFRWLEQASKDYNIETLTSGPAFIKNILQDSKLHNIKDIHIGGALTPNSLFEDIFKAYPKAQISHVYGSSEVEPVCLVDAKLAVKKSKERNLFHTLYLGKPIDEILFENKENGMWVTGPHVCSFYLNNQKENELNKRQDEQGRVWHFMGDRVLIDNQKDWWYNGRSQMNPHNFLNEQALYEFLGHDLAFFHSDQKDKIQLVGEGIQKKKMDLVKKFPFIENIYEGKIFKDKRHRSRIDRAETLKKIKLKDK
jgi:acyl-coenzyme A synthetase/AMP-(fatty) acid ligase